MSIFLVLKSAYMRVYMLHALYVSETVTSYVSTSKLSPLSPHSQIYQQILLFDYVTFVETTYLKTDLCNSESSQNHENRAQLADSSKPCKKVRACNYHVFIKNYINTYRASLRDIRTLISA